MRGALILGSQKFDHYGIIPADAGSTQKIDGLEAVYEDHPRGCGEHLSALRHFLPAGGSSPRMRGALVNELESCFMGRIIPADAGSTWS